MRVFALLVLLFTAGAAGAAPTSLPPVALPLVTLQDPGGVLPATVALMPVDVPTQITLRQAAPRPLSRDGTSYRVPVPASGTAPIAFALGLGGDKDLWLYVHLSRQGGRRFADLVSCQKRVCAVQTNFLLVPGEGQDVFVLTAPPPPPAKPAAKKNTPKK